jgi:excisionase family DNA binding protein
VGDDHGDQLLAVADVAARVGATEATVRRWIKDGELTAIKFGTRIGWRIRRRDFDRFLERRRVGGAVARQLLAGALADHGRAEPED